MSRVNELEEKLTYLAGLLEELNAGIPQSFHEYSSTALTKRGCERLVQLIVECAGDICELAVEIKNQPAPYSLYQSFIEASRIGLLPDEVARPLAEWTKVRNRLVHDYDRVDDAAMFGGLQPIQQQFVKHVQEFLEARSAGN